MIAVVVALFWMSGVLSSDEPRDGVRADELDEAGPGANSVTSVDSSAPSEAGSRSIVASDSQSADMIAVRADTGTPVAGAQVGCALTGSEEFWKSLTQSDRRALANGDIEVYHRLGEVLITDANGRCRVLVTGDARKVIVVADGLFAEAVLLSGLDEPQVVELHNDHDLSVRVVDASGKAARGIMIKLMNGVGIGSWGIGETDASGLIQCFHTQRFTRDGRGFLIKVRAHGHGVVSPYVDVDLFSARVVEVTLSLPRAGTLTFELLAETGGGVRSRWPR